MTIFIGIVSVVLLVLGGWAFFEDKLHLAIFLGVLSLTGFVYACYLDWREWEEYKQVHHCHETGDTYVTWTVVCQSNGKSSFCYPMAITHHEWACDEGPLWR